MTREIAHSAWKAAETVKKLSDRAPRIAHRRRGDAIEDALVSFGRWVLVHVFDDDAAADAAIGADAFHNPVRQNRAPARRRPRTPGPRRSPSQARPPRRRR